MAATYCTYPDLVSSPPVSMVLNFQVLHLLRFTVASAAIAAAAGGITMVTYIEQVKRKESIKIALKQHYLRPAFQYVNT